jgi:transposase
MTLFHRSLDLSDKDWGLLEPLLPGQSGQWGRVAHDNRRFVNAVFWILRTGAPWRDLPSDYGDWKNTHRRFCRWRNSGVWESLLERLMEEPGYEWLMVDTGYCKIHQYTVGAKGRYPGTERTNRVQPRYLWPWMRMVCRSELLLQKLPGQIVQKRLLSSRSG